MPSSPSKSSAALNEPVSPANIYLYQLTRPEGCLSKQEAIKDYGLKQSDFVTLKPMKTVPNPHYPSKKAYWFLPGDIESYLTSKIASNSNTIEGDNRDTPKKAKKSTSASSTAHPAGRKREALVKPAATSEGPVQVPRVISRCEEGESPTKKRKVESIAYFEILDAGSTVLVIFPFDLSRLCLQIEDL